MRLALFPVSSLLGNWPEGRSGDDQTNLVPTRCCNQKVPTVLDESESTSFMVNYF